MIKGQGELGESQGEGFIVEIGTGHKSGMSLLDLAPKIREKVLSGKPFLSIDAVKNNLLIPDLGAVKRIGLGKFAASDFLVGQVELMHVGNVFSETSNFDATDPRKLPAFTHIRNLGKKLIPGRGQMLILENYSAPEAAKLTQLPFAEIGLDAEIIIGADAYRKKLEQLGIAEHETALEYAKLYSESGLEWNPFIIILRRRVTPSTEKLP